MQQQQPPPSQPQRQPVGRQALLARLHQRRNTLAQQHTAVLASAHVGRGKLRQVDAAILDVDREIAALEASPPLPHPVASAPSRVEPAASDPASGDVLDRLLAACESVLADHPGLRRFLPLLRLLLQLLASSGVTRCL